MHAVILDIDGTLLPSDTADDTLYLAAVREVLGEVRVRASWGLYTHVSDAGILAEIFSDNAMDAAPDTVAAVRECFVASVARYISSRGPFLEVPGARGFVRALQDSAMYRVAYATGGWRSSAQLKLSTADFPVADIPLATSDDHPERQGIMRHALGQLDGEFTTITYYGDGHWDAVAAKAQGWQFVPVGRKLNGLASFQQPP